MKLGAVLNHPTGNKHDVVLLLDFELIAGDRSTAVIGFHSKTKKETAALIWLIILREAACLPACSVFVAVGVLFFKYPHYAFDISFWTPVAGINPLVKQLLTTHASSVD